MNNTVLECTNNLLLEMQYQEEGTFRNIGLYGISGTLNNWFVRTTNRDVVKEFTKLMEATKDAVRLFDSSGHNASDYVSIEDIDEFINRSIYRCDKKEKGSTCAVKAYFEAINKIIGSLATVYIGVLHENGEKTKVATFRELLKVNPKDRETQKLKKAIGNLYKSYIDTMSSKNLNKVWVMFGGLKTGKIKSDTKKDLTEKLDSAVNKSIKTRMFANKD
jgi:hypothetical protein